MKTLDAGNNRIAVLPPALGGLASLQRLVLTQNRLEAIGPVVQLSALKILLLDGNLLGSLPPALGQLTKLEKLSVSGNSLATLPAEIGCLRRARANRPPAEARTSGACAAPTCRPRQVAADSLRVGEQAGSAPCGAGGLHTARGAGGEAQRHFRPAGRAGCGATAPARL